MKTSIKKNEMALSRLYNSVTQVSGNLKDYIEFCLSNPTIYPDAVICWIPTDMPKKEM